MAHLLRGELPSFFINCHVPLTVSLILLYCPSYGETHRIHYLHSVLCDMLVDDCSSVSNVLSLLCAIGLATAI
jgi:hypothetical protein